MDKQYLEIKGEIRDWWERPDQDYDGIGAHGVNSSVEKEIWRSGLSELLGQKKMNALDIGTGTGFLALMLADMGHDVIGVDWSNTMLQKAKDKASELNIPIRFDLQDAEKLSFQDGTFDAAVSRHLLWTLADPYAAFKEWVRVVRSGGKVVVDVPRIGSRSGDHHYGADIGRNLPLSNGADPKKVSDMFREAELSNIDWLLFRAPGEMHRDTILIYGEKLGAITCSERMSVSDPEFL